MKLLLVAHDAGGVFQTGVRHGVAEVLEQQGRALTVVDMPSQHVDLGTANGVIALANVLPAEKLLELRAAGTVLTLVSHRIAANDIPTVMHENQQGMSQLLDHLFDDLGCSRPLLLGGEPSQLDAIERAQAFRDNLLRRGLDPAAHATVQGDFEPELAAARLEEQLQAGAEFDSLVAADYLMALAVLPVLARHGRQDLPVVGFGDGPEAVAAGLTTVAADVVELGRRAARQLLGQLPGGNPGHALGGRTLLATQLVVRQRR